MDLRLNGKRALVTGSTSGIGEQIAKTLAGEGVQVVVHGRRKTEANRVVQEITAAGGVAMAAIGDLGSDEETAEVVKVSSSAFGGIDILINNAGTFPMKPWLLSTVAEWLDLYNANVGSVVRLVTQLVPPMVERKWGRVVMLGSFLGPMPGPPVANYGTTKAANIAQAVSLAKELGGTGVTANTVSPGPIRTPGMEAGAREMMTSLGGSTTSTCSSSFMCSKLVSPPAGSAHRWTLRTWWLLYQVLSLTSSQVPTCASMAA